jgi:prepilin-type N-terminal cleavage/methylation domain-containing protein
MRRPSGFTIVEMMTTLAIVGVLAALSVAALGGMKNRGRFVSSSGDLLEGVRLTRSEAFSRGNPCVFIIDTVGGNWWSVTDVASAFSLSTFNPAAPVAGTDVVLASGTLTTGVTFGPGGSPGGYGVALPQPFAGVPSFSGSTPAPNFAYCSFCSTGAPAGYGAITFRGSGGAIFSGGPAAIGHQFTVQAPKPTGTGLQIMTIAVIARTGAVTTFETSQ